jgi:hypothetical protein
MDGVAEPSLKTIEAYMRKAFFKVDYLLLGLLIGVFPLVFATVAGIAAFQVGSD